MKEIKDIYYIFNRYGSSGDRHYSELYPFIQILICKENSKYPHRSFIPDNLENFNEPWQRLSGTSSLENFQEFGDTMKIISQEEALSIVENYRMLHELGK
jgi:hypothetical protein